MTMQGKICLITGGTNGIGKSTAQALAQMGATVVIVGRNAPKTAQVVEEIRAASGNNNVDSLLADLSSQQEVRRLADEFKSKYSHLHVLLNNAGGVFMQRQLSVDGIEMTFALNHLAYFLLTNLLLDTIKASAPARIINVSSDAHTSGKIEFDNLQGERRYSPGAYGNSKLANILFTMELARRLEGTGVTVNALHPGFVATGFAKNNGQIIATPHPHICAARRTFTGQRRRNIDLSGLFTRGGGHYRKVFLQLTCDPSRTTSHRYGSCQKIVGCECRNGSSSGWPASNDITTPITTIQTGENLA